MQRTSRLFLSNLRKFSTSNSAKSQHSQADLFNDIHKVLANGLETTTGTADSQAAITVDRKLCDISQYYFDGKGKAIRPRLCLAVADAVNHHFNPSKSSEKQSSDDGDDSTEMTKLIHNQRQIAIISEMFHTASLYHDDVIDKSEARRAKESVNLLWGQKSSVMSGDYIVAIANKLLGMTRDPEVIKVVLYHSTLYQLRRAGLFSIIDICCPFF